RLKHVGPAKHKDKLQAGIFLLELFNLRVKGATIVVGRWNQEIELYKVNYLSNENISQLKRLKRTTVLEKITIHKIQTNGYGLTTNTMKRSMRPKQTGAKKTAIPTRDDQGKFMVMVVLFQLQLRSALLFQDRRMQSDQVKLLENRKELYSILLLLLIIQ
ncbi:MAG: hypothetical protein EZS28_044739, partial [Streblomastix strix]